MKTNKSYTKRIRVTKNGKLMVRAKGQNHFNAREGSNTTRFKRRSQTIKLKPKDMARFLPRS